MLSRIWVLVFILSEMGGPFDRVNLSVLLVREFTREKGTKQIAKIRSKMGL